MDAALYLALALALVRSRALRTPAVGVESRRCGSCHHCGRELQLFSAKVERTAGCPYCHSDLKCCLNCRLHDPGANNQCREPQAEWQSDKDKANFCEFFEFREVSPLDAAGAGRRAAERDSKARAAFDALFGKKK